MIPTSIQQYLFISTKQTFTKPSTQQTIKHPLTLTNLSQHNIILKFRATHAKNIQVALRQIMIGPYQSIKYQITLKGQMQKNMTIKMQVTWCRIVPNANNGDKMSGQDVDRNLGKVDVENVGRRVVAFRRVDSGNDQANNNSKSQQNINQTTNDNNKNSQSTQQQQITELKQTIKTLQHQLQCNKTIINEMKQMNTKISELPNMIMANFIDSGVLAINKDKKDTKQNDTQKQVQRRINMVTDMISGLMKPGGLNQLLVKMEGLVWENKIRQCQDVSISNNTKSNSQQECVQQQNNDIIKKIQLPQYVRKLQQAFYQLVMQLFKKTNQMKNGNNI